MAKYLISYDLRSSDDYGGLHGSLEAINARRILRSLWIVDREGESADLIANTYLRRHIDPDQDRLLVVELDVGHWSKGQLINPVDSGKEV